MAVDDRRMDGGLEVGEGRGLWQMPVYMEVGDEEEDGLGE